MARRTVVVGLIAYVPAANESLSLWGALGDVVDVHEGNLARFDDLNVAPGQGEHPAAVDVPERPAGNASRESWAEFARAQGVEGIDDLTRDEIRAKFD